MDQLLTAYLSLVSHCTVIDITTKERRWVNWLRFISTPLYLHVHVIGHTVVSVSFILGSHVGHFADDCISIDCRSNANLHCRVKHLHVEVCMGKKLYQLINQHLISTRCG